MGSLQAALLGTLQGLTEFLPVSSSGHLVLAQGLIPSFSQPGALFDVILHLGTLFAILVYYKKSILKLSGKYVWYLVLGSIPVALIGYFFSDFIEALFVSTKVVGYALLLTGFFNLLTDMAEKGKKVLSGKKTLVVGVFQALAIVPGISRSGSTIFAGTKAGISREEAAKFSFLLSVPAVFGGNVLELIKHGAQANHAVFVYLVGFIFSAVFGYISIDAVIKLLKEKRFKMFAYYCFFLGILAILL